MSHRLGEVASMFHPEVVEAWTRTACEGVPAEAQDFVLEESAGRLSIDYKMPAANTMSTRVFNSGSTNQIYGQLFRLQRQMFKAA